MIDELMQQLHDPDAAVRRQAIIALGRTKDPAALKGLAEIVRGDPDLQLRELARKAGLYIRQQAQLQTQQSPLDQAPPAPRKSSSAAPFTVPVTGALDADASFMPRRLPDPPPEPDVAPPTTTRFQQLLEEERRKRVAELPDPDDLPDLPGVYESYTPYSTSDGEAEKGSSARASKVINSILDDQSAVEDEAQTTEKVEELRGRSYKIAKRDELRAKQYLDAALTLNIEGDNARAMKNLTQALELDPRLIKDTYFNSIATAVTELEGDAAVQMIVDQGERKRFTQDAARDQKSRREERHMGEALQSTWTDFWFELILYSLIVILGPILATLVTTESARNLLASITPEGNISPELQNMQALVTSLSGASLLPVGIISGLSGVFSLLLQTLLIHLIATKMLHGHGTWRHLISVLLGFYNRWFPILFFLLYITIAMFFISQASPIMLCFVLVLVILALYVSGKTSGKVGEAYDFGGAMGCVSLIMSSVVIILLNFALGYVFAQVLGSSLQLTFGGSP